MAFGVGAADSGCVVSDLLEGAPHPNKIVAAIKRKALYIGQFDFCYPSKLVIDPSISERSSLYISNKMSIDIDC